MELAVKYGGDAHALAFPCRRVSDGWIDAMTLRRLDFHPTHWRDWSEKAMRAICIDGLA